MGTIRIKPGSRVKESICDQCGGTNRLLHGFVYEDDNPHGVYFLEWCDSDHADRTAFLTVALGAWGDDTEADDRAAFSALWREDGMSLTEEPARDRLDLLGRFVPRSVALTMPDIEHLWHIADHIVRDDQQVGAVQEWLRPEGR